MSFTEVQMAEQHFNASHDKAEASQNLITDVENILQAAHGDPSLAQKDIAQLNQDLHLKDKGFPDDFAILGATGNELVLQDLKDKRHLLVLDNSGTLKFDGGTKDALDYVGRTTRGGNAQSRAADNAAGQGQGDGQGQGNGQGKGDGQQDSRDYPIEKGDSLWKIAKNDLPPGATPREILEHVHEIEALNPQITDPDKIKAGDSLKLPAKANNQDNGGNGGDSGSNGGDKTNSDKPNGGNDQQPQVTTDANGNKVTTWADGTERHENADGTGYVKHPDKSEEHWGPKADDNYELTKDGEKVPVTYGSDGEKIKHFKDGSTVTVWKDGVEKHENADGTGYVKQPDGYEHHWGPKPEDNYEVSDGVKLTGEHASMTKTYPDGTVKTVNGDGSGSVKNPDGSEHHWGPNAADNYDVAADGSRTTKQEDGCTICVKKDGSKTTTWPDGTVESENKDGTIGYVRKPDGSEHHWGPRDDQNYEVTADGGIQRTDAAGNKITIWHDGTVRYENADGSGKVMQPQPDGTYKVHHWGPDEADNYDETTAPPSPSNTKAA